MDNRAIGVYDSGIGGLSVWRAIRSRLSKESMIYLGDGANCPYGLRPTAEIKELAHRAVETLVRRGCKMIVVACNTATGAAIEELRALYSDIPIVGMEPAIKPACLQTKSGVVGVLATQRSLEGDMFHRTAAKYGENIRVISRFGKGFVEIVEENRELTPQAEVVVEGVVKELVSEGVDQIVLGCSHYPFLIDLIARFAPNVNIIDPAPAIAKQVERLLKEYDLEAAQGAENVEYEFLSFAGEEYIDKLRSKAQGV